MAMAIGGFFELEFNRGTTLYPQALGFNSARFALQALLQASVIKRLYLPDYTCSTMHDAALRSGVEVVRYPVDDQLQPVELPTLNADEHLQYVNYFGLKDDYIRQRLWPALSGRLIIDNAQSLFSAPLDGVPTLYSPRKFVGVPDGGWLVNGPADIPGLEPGSSEGRTRALIGRLEAGPEPFYGTFIEVEHSIRDEGMRGMSALTARLLDGLDYSRIRARRQANFAVLRERLDGLNGFSLFAGVSAPMVYPLLLASAEQANQVRSALQQQRIYVATYWRELLDDPALGAAARRWTECMLPLPIDQRYDDGDMERVAGAVLQALGRT
ncbi:hypothetical protein [Pseudomonas baltica]|uniref:hypothetical protein n=1 Tax=Pseudomonas baltica TaxID=2762576 RepID=UPI00289F512E|nr:hypothetical protein [Pseudomonas baltica]